MKAKKGTLIALLAILCVIFIYIFKGHYLSLPELKLNNVSDTSIDSVYVFVSGGQYIIPSIGAKQKATVEIEPTFDSHIELKVGDSGPILIVDVYLEPSSRGDLIEIDFTRDSLYSFTHHNGLF